MKLSERKKQLGVTLSLAVIAEMAEVSHANYLGQMWRDGKCEKVEKILVESQKRFNESKFNFKTI